ncbi:MAG TPA: exodeoxyribonuclease VII small subunit [Dehalococcoidia bacterium]|nr:exodeoxyribonuclease VII small subunit [Dehalococcoidia bacterium]
MAREQKQPKTATFEELYTRLEASVAKLEQGGLSLDESIALYEDGMMLARACQERLDAAEQRITKLHESFAPPPRGNGAMLNDSSAEESTSTDDPGREESGDYP